MGCEARTEQTLVRQNVVDARRCVALYDQSATHVANVERPGHDADEAADAGDSCQNNRGNAFRISRA